MPGEVVGMGVRDEGPRLRIPRIEPQVELGQVPGVRDHARIGAVDAVDVAVDLAALGAERGRERDRRRVRAAAPERRDFARDAHALVPRDDHDAPALELRLDAVRTNFDDARVEVAIVRDDARLRTGEAHRVPAARADRDGQERHADALAGADEHVELPLRDLRALAAVPRRGLARELEQAVGGLAHRAHDDDHPMPAPSSRHHDVRDLPQLAEIGERRASELLHDDAHRG